MLDALLLSAAVVVQQGNPTFEAGVIKPTATTTSGVSGGCRGVDSRLAPDDSRNPVETIVLEKAQKPATH